MENVISFAIGDVVSYVTRTGEPSDGTITDASLNCGRLRYAIDGCAWFSLEENNIALLHRATEESLQQAKSLLDSDEEDSDDSDENPADYESFSLKGLTFAIRFRSPRVDCCVYWFDRIKQEWVQTRTRACEFTDPFDAHQKVNDLLASMGRSAQLTVVRADEV